MIGDGVENSNNTSLAAKGALANTLALSWILSKIENLASSNLQDEAKLNFYPRVWHS